MAAVPVTINGVIVDMYGRTITGPVKIVGEMVRSDVGVGGGPIEGGGGEGIWGPGDPRPQPPIHLPPEGGDGKPPSIWPSPGRPAHPIVLPPEQVPPEQRPPDVPPPGTVTPVPPPAGSGGWPTTGIVPPPYVVLAYPGVGPVYVTPPPHAEPAG